jgi:Kef-type K+ transport system membrane component KefB
MQLALCFAAIGISAALAEKTGLFFAPFYIIAGFLLGPGMFNLVSNTEIISLLGEIGVVFLLFFLGLEFSLHALLKKKTAMLLAGLVDFFVNFGLGFALGLLLGFPLFDCLVIAGAVYMSSSGIITKSLLELQVNKNPEGQLVMGIMVFEDLCMILFLAILSSGASSGSGFQLLPMLTQLLKSLLYCAVVVLFAIAGKRLLNRILNIRKSELLLIVFFGLVLLVTSIGEWLGVSAALCAFFLGMAFSRAENVKNIEHTTVIFRDLFGSVFFFSFGMMLTLGDVAGHWVFLLLCVLVAGQDPFELCHNEGISLPARHVAVHRVHHFAAGRIFSGGLPDGRDLRPLYRACRRRNGSPDDSAQLAGAEILKTAVQRVQHLRYLPPKQAEGRLRRVGRGRLIPVRAAFNLIAAR